MTNEEKILFEIVKARDRIAKAMKMNCTCDPSDLQYNQICTCLKRQEVDEARSKFWEIIHGLETTTEKE